jgi:Ethanolamine utilization protein EutJ (predicted chaperonin)
MLPALGTHYFQQCTYTYTTQVVRVIEEPTAAAVAYQLHKKSNIHHILVYDFGGGTLDVSLLYVAKGSVQVPDPTPYTGPVLSMFNTTSYHVV